MNQNELRKKCSRLLDVNLFLIITICKIFIYIFFQAVINHHIEKVTIRADLDAKMVMQMITKALHLRNTPSNVSVPLVPTKKKR